jgi:hypothetical protein
MFAALKSLLSAHVAPGAGYVDVRPFSFPLFARIEVNAYAGDDAKRLDELTTKIMEVDRLLDADDLKAGRDRLKTILRELTE